MRLSTAIIFLLFPAPSLTRSFFFFNDTATTETYTLSLHDALPIYPRGLQEPSLFMTTPTSGYSVSPDGKRIALIRTSQTGEQIVTFSTARPNAVTTVLDLAGSGERATGLVWAGDAPDSILFNA